MPSIEKLGDMSFSGNERDPLFANDGHGHFEDVGYQANVDLPGDGRSGVFADLDGDGDLDLVVRQMQQPSLLVLRNDASGKNRSIEVSLVGVKTNRMGLGAVVHACVAERCQHQELRAGHGYLSQGPAIAHFGIAEAPSAELSITWPTGVEQKLGPVPAGSRIRATEGKEGFETLAAAKVQLGPPAPPPLDGSALGLPAGKPALVNLWAPWCKPCKDEAPTLAAFRARAGDALATIALSLEPDAKLSADGWKALGTGWSLQLADKPESEVLAHALDGIDLPATLAFDANGKLVGAVVGKVSPAALERLSAAALGH